MQLRFPPQLKADLSDRADLMGVSCAEMVRRSIKRYCRAVEAGRRVVLGENEETATRENSTPGDYYLGDYDGKILHRDVLRIVRWALDDTAHKCPEPFVPPKVDYVEVTR